MRGYAAIGLYRPKDSNNIGSVLRKTRYETQAEASQEPNLIIYHCALCNGFYRSHRKEPQS